jgi:hypothetical protein
VSLAKLGAVDRSSKVEEVKGEPTRSYGQFCGLARALDVVGDRWSLLIVRELLPGPMRYSALATSIGGIATTLLAARPGGDALQPRWLAVALEAPLDGRTAEPPPNSASRLPAR